MIEPRAKHARGVRGPECFQIELLHVHFARAIVFACAIRVFPRRWKHELACDIVWMLTQEGFLPVMMRC